MSKKNILEFWMEIMAKKNISQILDENNKDIADSVNKITEILFENVKKLGPEIGVIITYSAVYVSSGKLIAETGMPKGLHKELLEELKRRCSSKNEIDDKKEFN